MEPYDNLGNSVSSAGDINGDGLDDLIIGAFGAGPKIPGYGFSYQYGAAYVIFGKDSGFSAEFDLTNLNGSNGFSLKGAVVFDSLGFEVSDAGDVNGDGFDDVIIGTLFAEANGTSESGLSYIVFGKATGFSASMNISDLNGSNGFRLDGIENSDYTGRKVSSAGDVNGDGFDDVIVVDFKQILMV